ncbi:MAG TPA: hypothetical protein VFA20_13415, partial [Myxococcaceae bacterium]|nr:hypothetical protein [Myxococcaceae bacterium]
PSKASTPPESDGDGPNGTMESCKVIQEDFDTGEGRRVTLVAGGRGIFLIALPTAPDWRFQCDGEHLFWSSSSAARMQVTVTLYKPEPGEDVTPAKYLADIGARLKTGLESAGFRVSDKPVFSIRRADGEEIHGLEMRIDAPAGQVLPLFPQDTFFTTRQGPLGYMFDAHVTTYPRDAEDGKALTASAHDSLARFIILDWSKQARMFPGVSAATLSGETLAAMKAALDCKAEKMSRYCGALDRFAKAAPLPRETSHVWAGSALMAAADREGKLAVAVENLHALHVKDGKGSFGTVRPSNESEAKEMEEALQQIHQGKAPSRTSALMQYLSQVTPPEASPLESRLGSLSFNVEASPGPGPSVFVRENDEEVLVVEIWEGNHSMMIGIFPKER